MHIYNERDVIVSTINHLLDQGADVHIIDNWSTDGTLEIVKAMAKKSKRITYEIFPEKNTRQFELGKMMTRVTDVAKDRPEYAWVTLNDADEIRWSPWPGVTLQEAFSFLDSVGFNAVDYTVFNFVPTREGFNEHNNLIDFFKFGRFSGVEGHFLQIKSWKNNQEADMALSGGHQVLFTGQKVFPLKFFMGHYPLRSTEHARHKIFEDRQPRYSKKEKAKGWHVHYSSLPKSTSFVESEAGLVDVTSTDFSERFIIERLSGIGIPRDT
jgi:glycosyltransferase involved in cell wall biosynthesis